MARYKIEEIKNIAVQIQKNLQPGTVLALKGDLGAGKTTLTSVLIKELGFSDRVQSPTFVILRKYVKTQRQDIVQINHFDLYRITSEEELMELDFEGLIRERKTISIIEWPDIANRFLPQNTIRINLHYVSENERDINVQN